MSRWAQAMSRHGALLAGFAAVLTGVIVLTWQLTSERIAEQQALAELRALQELISADVYDNELLADSFTVGPDSETLGLRGERTAYRARRAGRTVAVILPVRAPDGYSGGIDLMVGILADGTVSGVRVLSHRETPGLGDDIELRKSNWVLDFNGRSLTEPAAALWKVRKDGGVFDQFTGATITPRAVVRAVRRALEYAERERTRLFDTPPALAAEGGKR
jgi:electron transport complex protein RnfG